VARGGLGRTIAVGVLSLLGLRAAHAQEATKPAAPLLQLRWQAPAECPSEAQVIARVEELVGPRRASQRGLVARGVVTRTGERYRLELSLRAVETARVLSGDDCARLADAAALVMALDIDPDASTREAPAEEPPADPVIPEAVPTPEQPPVHQRPRRPAPTVRAASLDVVVGARAVLDSGALPRATMGVGGATNLSYGPWALDVQVVGYQAQFTVNGPRRGVGGAYVALVALTAHGCLGGVTAGVDLRGCVGLELGRESTRGVSIARPETSSSLWTGVSGMLRGRLWASRSFSPVAGLMILHPIGAPSVTIQGFGTVFRPSPVVVRPFLGVEVHFL
jgi:hypothetical protein